MIGLIGLGPMGRNLAANLRDKGVAVAGWERDPALRAKARAALGDAVAGERVGDMIAALAPPRCVILMIASGAPVDRTLARIAPLLAPGDAIADAGNAHPADTERRQRRLHARGIDLLGVGISGGPKGARRGPAIMAGGPLATWRRVQPAFDAIAARAADGTPCAGWFGTGGAGHFVKMVHNGIEYAVMQLLAEALDLLSAACGRRAAEIAGIFRALEGGPAGGFLARVAAEVVAARRPGEDAELIDLVDDAAEQKGTGRWAVEAALSLGVAAPTLAEAVFARSLSGDRERRADAAVLAAQATAVPATDDIAALLPPALALATASAFAQGFALFDALGDRYGAPLDRLRIAQVWRAGCVLQGAMVELLARSLEAEPGRIALLAAGGLRPVVETGRGPLRRLVAAGAAAGVPVPAFASALAYAESLGRARLPTRLTQLQRDYFGGHGLSRRGGGAPLHGPWSETPDDS